MGNEVDGFLVDVGEQLVRDPGHAHFGVAHRRGRIAVDGAEVALAVDQHHPASRTAAPMRTSASYTALSPCGCGTCRSCRPTTLADFL